MRRIRIGRILGWGVRLIVLAIGLALFVFVLATLSMAFEGRTTFPAPMRSDAAIAKYLPQYRYRQAYEVGVDAPPEQVYRALRTMDLRRIPAMRVMLELRDAPSLLSSLAGRSEYSRPFWVTLDSLKERGGWQVLEETPGSTLVLGAITRPWEPGAPRPPFTSDSFGRFGGSDYVKMAVSFDALPRTGGGTRLTVEWRLLPTDGVAMRKLSRYWLLASPFVRLTAKTGLPRIRTVAENRAARMRGSDASLAERAATP